MVRIMNAAMARSVEKHLRSWVRLGLAGSVLGLCAIASEREGAELIGTAAPEWEVTHWINSEPVRLEDLRGKVVLVRWWTAPQCHYCQATAPALNAFHERFQSEGLNVIGFYHHKASAPLRVSDVRQHARQFEFKFPVAIDPDWKTLRQWWLGSGGKRWTSVTFLLDREGAIRHIHPGGQYVQGDDDYRALEGMILKLLAEPH
jgi:peroxiredoxin